MDKTYCFYCCCIYSEIHRKAIAVVIIALCKTSFSVQYHYLLSQSDYMCGNI